MDKNKRVKTAFISALVFAGLVTLFSNAAQASSQIFSEANQHYANEDYLTAIKGFKQALNQSPSYNVIRYYLADSYYRLHDFESAISYAKDYIQQLAYKDMLHHSSHAYYLIGQAYVALDDPSSAVSNFEAAIKYANTPKTYRFDALIAAQISAHQDVFSVLRSYDKAIAQFGPTSEYQTRAIDLLLKNNQHLSAMRRVKYLLKLDSQNGEYRDLMSRIDAQIANLGISN